MTRQMDQDLRTALDELSKRATPGPWAAESEKSEGLYGSGEDTSEGYDTAVIVTEAEHHYGKAGVLFESHNSTVGSIREEHDDEWFRAWDEVSEANAKFIVALVNAYRAGDLSAAPPRPVDAERLEPKRLEFLRREYSEYDRDAKLGTVHGTATIGEFLDLIVSAHSPDKAVTRAGVDPLREAFGKAIWTETGGKDGARNKLTLAFASADDAQAADRALDYILSDDRPLTPRPTGTEASRGVVQPLPMPAYAYQQHEVRGVLAANPTPPVTPDSTGPAGAERAPLVEAYHSLEAILSQQNADYPDHEEVIIGRGRSRFVLCEYRDIRDAVRRLDALAVRPTGTEAGRGVGAETATIPIDDYRTLVAALEADDTFVACEICGAWLTSEENSHGADINACWARAVEGGDKASCRSYRSLPTPASDVPGDAQTQEGGR